LALKSRFLGKNSTSANSFTAPLPDIIY